MASFKTRRHMDLRRVRHCVSYKISYESKSEALNAAERAMDLGMVMPGCHIVPYECLECGRWHLANKVIVPMAAHHRTMFQLTDTERE